MGRLEFSYEMVKFNNKKYTYKDFARALMNKIQVDPYENEVFFDTDERCYKIKYDSKIYIAYYGTERIRSTDDLHMYDPVTYDMNKYFKELIAYTKEQRKRQEKEKKEPLNEALRRENMGSINFNLLGTVRIDNKEYTYADFYKIISDGILNNGEKNGVMYDSVDNCYKVVYNYKIYQVFYRGKPLTHNSSQKNIVNELNNLVELTNNKNQEYVWKKEAEQEENKAYYEAIANGDKSVFKTEEDKKRYLKYLKDEIKSTKVPWTVFFSALGILASIILTIGTTIYLGIYQGVSDIMVLINMLLGTGLVFTSAKLYFIDKEEDRYFFDTFKYKRKLKKKVKQLEKSLSKKVTNSIHNTKTMVQEAKINDLDEVKESETKEVKHSAVDVIVEDFEKLTQKIDKIKSVEERKKYSKEILNMINNYKEAAKSFIKNGDTLSVHQNIVNQIVSMSERVEGTIRQEEQLARSQKEFEQMLDEVNRLASRR